jgi:hypothetical protein
MSRVSFVRWCVIALVLGLAAGLLWWGITDTATFTITKDGVDIRDDETRRQFGAIVNFVAIGAGLCLLLGFSVAFFSDVSWPAVPIVAFMSGAAAVLAWTVGRLAGPGDPARNPPVGSRLQDALTVDAVAPFFAWAAFGVAGLLLGMWLFEHEADGQRQ